MADLLSPASSLLCSTRTKRKHTILRATGASSSREGSLAISDSSSRARRQPLVTI
jgi:hypothetical protein